MFRHLKTVVLVTKFIVALLICRPYRSLIKDIANKYDELDISDLRKFEKLSLKCRKAELDVLFLKNCKLFGVFPKFVVFPIPTQHRQDAPTIRKRLLKSATQRRISERSQLEKERDNVSKFLKTTISILDYFILQKALSKNIEKFSTSIQKTHDKKLANLTRNHSFPLSASDVIQNKSSYVLSKEEEDILKYGLRYALPPSKVSRTDVFCEFEKMQKFFSKSLKAEYSHRHITAELQTLAENYVSSYRPSSSTLKRHGILKKLKNNKDIVVTRPDKGESVVIMNRKDYYDSVSSLIQDPQKFRRVKLKTKKDVTEFREGQLQRYLLSLKKKDIFSDDIYDSIYPVGSIPARLYGLPKIHKVDKESDQIPPFRPIISSIGSYNYNLAKYLNSLLCPCIPSEFSCSDSFTFVREIQNLEFQKSFLVSFDVESLFTNVPVKETTEIAMDLIYQHHKNLKISRPQLRKLFQFATSQTHFIFDGQYYDQVDGLAMGSPLGPTMANIFMGKHEKEWLQNFSGSGVLFYRRYIDDIFCVFEKEENVLGFFEYLNSRHPNIKFTMEKENNEVLSFLDVLVKKEVSGKFITTTYRKPTFTGLLTNFTSFISSSYKFGLIKTLFNRAAKINSSEAGLEQDKSFVTKILLQNSFPRACIDRVKNEVKLLQGTENVQISAEQNIRFFKLPFIGEFSKLTQINLKRISEKYCRGLPDFRIIFVSSKIGSLFSNKEKLSVGQMSNVIYKFSCAGCNSSYIGETTRNFHKRAFEHLSSDKKSVVYKHLKKQRACKRACNVQCFSILDKAATQYSLKVKEALFIGKHKPDLNIQVKSLQVALSL